jgi:hypothetical protein
MYNVFMPKSIPVIRKKRGRPATGMDPVYALRIPPELVARVDFWAEAQDPPASRSEAIRALIEQALRRQKA